MPRTPARITQAEPTCLFPTDQEIAKLVLGRRAEEWPVLVHAFEMDGLPKIDDVAGGRYWPAVRAWFDARYGLATVPPQVVPLAPDGVEDFDAGNQRRTRSATAKAR